MLEMDKLIQKYAEELETIYNMRTAGEYTFNGVLAKMLWDGMSQHILTVAGVE